ncbi:MAG TPA: histidine phosphatase family protein [Burkholderiaceae bacterium]|mgnify:FL=1|nr:histidine phosphatase family protein [Burkholderiaceae bacterium]
MQATRITAVRHGETAWNVETRIQGQLDIPLNETGRWQAQRLARALAARESNAAIYSSDLLRAWDTAISIADATKLTLKTDEGLRERGFGTFQGKTYAEIEATWPQETLRWRKREPEWSPPEGESLLQFRQRVLDTAQALAARHMGEQIVMVAHGGVMDVLYRAATGLDLQATRTWALGNAAINRLLWTPDGFTIVGWADTSHLDDETMDETTA